MKIVVCEGYDDVLYDSFKAGNVFIYNDKYFMKTNQACQRHDEQSVMSVNVENGEMAFFSHDDYITPVKCELRIL